MWPPYASIRPPQPITFLALAWPIPPTLKPSGNSDSLDITCGPWRTGNCLRTSSMDTSLAISSLHSSPSQHHVIRHRSESGTSLRVLQLSQAITWECRIRKTFPALGFSQTPLGASSLYPQILSSYTRRVFRPSLSIWKEWPQKYWPSYIYTQLDYNIPDCKNSPSCA